MVDQVKAPEPKQLVAHHCDAVGDLENLIQAVGDVENGDTLSSQATNDGKEADDFLIRQGRRRFIHDD